MESLLLLKSGVFPDVIRLSLSISLLLSLFLLFLTQVLDLKKNNQKIYFVSSAFIHCYHLSFFSIRDTDPRSINSSYVLLRLNVDNGPAALLRV